VGKFSQWQIGCLSVLERMTFWGSIYFVSVKWGYNSFLKTLVGWHTHHTPEASYRAHAPDISCQACTQAVAQRRCECVCACVCAKTRDFPLASHCVWSRSTRCSTHSPPVPLSNQIRQTPRASQTPNEVVVFFFFFHSMLFRRGLEDLFFFLSKISIGRKFFFVFRCCLYIVLLQAWSFLVAHRCWSCCRKFLH